RRQVAMPAIDGDEVLVRVRAASLNPLDLYYLRGSPYIARIQVGLTRPRAKGLGLDMAGTIEAVGGNVTRLQPGDEGFGGSSQTLAQDLSVRADTAVLRKPAHPTFQRAA